jgi:hypothetical protein
MNLKLNVLPLVTSLGLALVPVVSHADDGGGDYLFPSSNVKYEPAVESHALSCAEATRIAWFHRQVEISDGDVTPSITMPAECDRKVFAQGESSEGE